MVGWGIIAELSPLPSSEHHKRSAGAQCAQRGTCRDAYGPRNAYLWRHQAPICGGIKHLWLKRLSVEASSTFGSPIGQPQVIRTGGWVDMTNKLSPLPSSEHHKRSTGAQCTQRGTCRDAYGPCNAYLWRHQAPLAHPLVNLRCAEPVVGGESQLN